MTLHADIPAGSPPRAHGSAFNRRRARLRRLAWVLDSSIRLPGGFRIGLDGLIGLIPGAGDLFAAGLSSYILLEAVRMRAPTPVVARITGNILAELLIGAIPLFGDVFDFVFKANERNIRLLDAHFETLERLHRHGS